MRKEQTSAGSVNGGEGVVLKKKTGFEGGVVLSLQDVRQ